MTSDLVKRVEYRDLVTRDMLRREPETLFVFGDNLERRGYGGQAAEMRGEPNAVGIPTKRAPRADEEAFLRDTDACLAQWRWASRTDVRRLRAHPGKIVWPAAGIGTGRAQLQARAPRVWDEIERLRESLERGE